METYKSAFLSFLFCLALAPIPIQVDMSSLTDVVGLAFNGISSVAMVASLGLQISGMFDHTTEHLLRTVVSNLQIIEQQQQQIISLLGVVITILTSIMSAISQLPISPTFIRIQNVPAGLQTLEVTNYDPSIQTLYMNQWLGLTTCDSLAGDLETLHDNILGTGILLSQSVVNEFYSKAYDASHDDLQSKLGALSYMVNVMGYEMTGYTAYMWALSKQTGMVLDSYNIFIHEHMKDQANWARKSFIGDIWHPAYQYSSSPLTSTLATLDIKRTETFSVNGKFYIISSRKAVSSFPASLKCFGFDPATTTWYEIPTPPIPSSAPTISVAFDKTIGKWVLIINTNPINISLFDANTETWSAPQAVTSHFTQAPAVVSSVKAVYHGTSASFIAVEPFTGNVQVFTVAQGPSGLFLTSSVTQTFPQSFESFTHPVCGLGAVQIGNNKFLFVYNKNTANIEKWLVGPDGFSLLAQYPADIFIVADCENYFSYGVVPNAGSARHDTIMVAYLDYNLARVLMIDSVTGSSFTYTPALGTGAQATSLSMTIIGGAAYVQVNTRTGDVPTSSTFVYYADSEPTAAAWETHQVKTYDSYPFGFNVGPYKIAAFQNASAVVRQFGAVGGIPVLLNFDDSFGKAEVYFGIATEMYANVVPGY